MKRESHGKVLKDAKYCAILLQVPVPEFETCMFNFINLPTT